MGNKDESKKPAAGGAPAPQEFTQKAPAASKGASGAKVGCHAVSCKEKDHRANFCDEHFRQYKFGLIKKTGEKVLDWERKFEHYQKWLKAQKVA